MARKLHIGCSPITGTIYAGTVLKDGRTWGSNKTDVIGAAIGAVCEHVMLNKGEVRVSLNGKPKFKITIKEIQDDA